MNTIKNNKTLLFVTDNQEDRKSYHQMLAVEKSQLSPEYSFHVLEACSCSEAVSQLENNNIDCILVNDNLPEMTGVEFSKQLYKQSEYKVPPIIIVTTKQSATVVAEAMRAGISDFLIKDETTPHMLYSTVKHCIDEVCLKNKIGETRAEVKDLTYHDRLTGLPNRFFFNKIIENEIARASRAKQTVSLLMIDVDDFKHINDTLGHPAGDEVIAQFALRIENIIRCSDIVARIDGDGFAVIAPEQNDPLNSGRVAEKIHDAIKEVFTIQNGQEEVYLTCSIGISNYPAIADNTVDLLRSADAAMHESKERGKNIISYFRKDINEQYINYIQTVKNLKKAIGNNELFLNYQPKYNVATQKMTGAEALLRWNQGNEKLISPAEFIPIAERSRLMPQIGSWVFEEAIKQAATWQKEYPNTKDFSLAINLSPYQLTGNSDEFLNLLKKLLKEYKVPAKMIEIEITETALMQKITNIQSFIKELSKLGVKIAIDDFGTGFSSLERLKTLDVNTLKIDQSFIQGIETNDKDAVIARAAINLGQNLGLRIIAEGVETSGQLKFLKDNHCDELQGFMLARPMAASELEKLLV